MRQSLLCTPLFLALVIGVGVFVGSIAAEEPKRPFSVRDDIETGSIGDSVSATTDAVRFSPDGKYLAVYTVGRALDLNIVHDRILVFNVDDIRRRLGNQSESPHSKPFWEIADSGVESPVIRSWCWLSNSSGIAFVKTTASTSVRQIMLADIRRRSITSLTSEYESIDAYQVVDLRHLVYSSTQSQKSKKTTEHRSIAQTIGTGRSIWELLHPDDPSYRPDGKQPHLWTLIDGKRSEVKNSNRPITAFGDFALSPDGKKLVTTLPVQDVDSSWERLYTPPRYTVSSNRIHAGHYEGERSPIHQYVAIDLAAGTVTPLLDAPVAGDSGWIGFGAPSWSSDGSHLLLPNTFLSQDHGEPSRPCVAVMDLPSRNVNCVETLTGYLTETKTEEGHHVIVGARFSSDPNEVMIAFFDGKDETFRTAEYQRAAHNEWRKVNEYKGMFRAEFNGLEIGVKQGLNTPPVLMATERGAEQVIWNASPELRRLEWSEASIYTWTDDAGRDWRAGLYRPQGSKAGDKFPLVVQTHGFPESEFHPSGGLPTAFAAQELAAGGVMVLQSAKPCPFVTTEEGPCAVAGYEAAIRKLVAEGLVDPDRVGIIGFSRTCFDVMEMLTSASTRLRAASITDGILENYVDYVLTEFGNGETEKMIGARPFGNGLQTWLKRSPVFNLDKVRTALMVVGEGPDSTLLMWEPYAGLRYLHKPVDLIMLNTDEHVLTNPAVRYASQQGSVDWFRFWLQGYEDPDPSKADQYVRWRQLREMQEANDKKAAAEKAAKSQGADTTVN